MVWRSGCAARATRFWAGLSAAFAASALPRRPTSICNQHFFSTTGSLLLALQPRREGDVWGSVHVYDSESRQLAPCDPIWVIDPARLPAGDRNAASPAAVARRGRARTFSEDRQQPAGDAIPPPGSLSTSAAQPPGAVRQTGGSRTAAPLFQRGSAWDSVPHNVWLLLALGIVLAICGAAWLWLFQSDVVRPLLLRWTSSLPRRRAPSR